MNSSINKSLIAFYTIMFLIEARRPKISPKTIFREEQIIFSSEYNITKLLVPADINYVAKSDMPSLFFVVSDPKARSSSCIYVLEGLAAFEVLEGGKDCTADYGSDKSVYFGAKDGVYKYNSETLSAKRIGVFRDDIIQIQKLNGTDTFIVLTADGKLYKLEKEVTVKTKLDDKCVTQFVVDVSNNIYYTDCKDNNINIIRTDGSVIVTSDIDDFKDLKLVRPPYVLDDCIPLFGDGNLYILCSNGTLIKKDFSIEERPSAFSFDSALYLILALNGKIYEYNIIDLLVESMFGMINEWPSGISKLVLSLMDTKDWNGFLIA